MPHTDPPIRNTKPENQTGTGSEAELRERLKFEALLSDLSARFINLSPEESDRKIKQAMEQIMIFFQVDRCALVRVLRDRDAWEITHFVQRDEGFPLPVNMELPRKYFPGLPKE